jgi:protein TonB
LFERNLLMSRYRRKRVLFVCIGNACRSPMAEAIARVDASDIIDAFSAGLAPTGLVTDLTEQTLIRNGYWVDGLKSKKISRKVWEQIDIVINMSGRPRELAFHDYSKVEGWEIDDPYGEGSDTYQRVFEEIRLRVTRLAQECREEQAAVPLTERRARERWYPTSPMFMHVDGRNDPVLLNISEDGLALSAATTSPNRPFHNMQVQSLGSPYPLEAGWQTVWKSESENEVGIQFVGLTEEERQHIRSWISAQASASNLQPQRDRICEKQNPQLEIPKAPQPGNRIPGASVSGGVIDEPGEVSLFSPTAAPTLSSADPPVEAPRTYAHSGIRPNKKALQPRWSLAGVLASPGVFRQEWGTILALGFLVGLIAFTLESGTIRHNAPDEGVAAFTQKPAVLSEAAKRITPAPVTTTPSVPNSSAGKTQAQTSLAEPLPVEKDDSFQDTLPKHSPRPANLAKKPLPAITAKTAGHRVESVLTRGQSKKELPRAATNVNISPLKKTQQQAPSGPPPTPPQMQAKIEQPANPVPLASHEIRAPEPESKASSAPAAIQPSAPANITAAVAILADPYPSIRIPNGNPKKQRQGTSLQLGHLLSRVEPVYPEDAKQQGIQGTVKLHAIIDRRGSVENLQSVNGPPLLVAAAMNAVRQWRFTETLLAGQSVETEEDIDITFRLSNSGAPRK